MVEEDVDLTAWLSSRSITKRDAQKILTQVRQQYPWLGKLLEGKGNLRAKLDLLELIGDVQTSRFPVSQKGTSSL